MKVELFPSSFVRQPPFKKLFFDISKIVFSTFTKIFENNFSKSTFVVFIFGVANTHTKILYITVL